VRTTAAEVVCARHWWRRRCARDSGGGGGGGVRATTVVLGWCGRCSWAGGGCGAGVAVLAGGLAGPLGFTLDLEKLSLPRAMWPHGTRVPRASEVALSKETFAGPAVSSAFCREHSLCRE
jgi:hypothetical protein